MIQPHYVISNKLRSLLDFVAFYLLVVVVHCSNALCCNIDVQANVIQFKSKLQELHNNNYDVLASIDCSRSVKDAVA